MGIPDKRERKKRERTRKQKAVRTGMKGSTRLAAPQMIEAVAKEARQRAARYLRRDDLAAKAVELADAVRKLALQMMQQSPDSGRHECRPGCAFCCHTAITVAAPEAFAITGYLLEHYSEDEMRLVRRRTDENAELASSMTRDEYIAKNVPCALLTEDGNCRVHPVRPLACAGFCSTSLATCEAEFNRVPDRDPVPTDKFTMLTGLGVSYGLKDACKRAGLDGDFYELHHALRRVLDTPNAAERWARKENLFDGCLL